MSEEEKELKAIFMDFCTFGDKNNTGIMDNVKFAKFAKGKSRLTVSPHHLSGFGSGVVWRSEHGVHSLSLFSLFI